MTKNQWSNKSVLITGICGTVGLELLNQLKDKNCRHIIGIDNNESEIFLLSQKFKSFKKINILLCDIKNRDIVNELMRDIDIILHVAALKNVDVCEKSPIEAINTNIEGLNNLLDAAEKNDVERFLFTSSDKAANPTNVMGTTKLLGEKLVTAKNMSIFNKRKTKFFSTRFGNVLGSAGSVLPVFLNQIKNGGPLTITDKKMTRFIMSIEQSAKMVLDSVWLAEGGEVFVTKMPVIRIYDLANCIIKLYQEKYALKNKIELKYIGKKQGEKLYEELLTEDESLRSIQSGEYYIIYPSFDFGTKQKKLKIKKNNVDRYLSTEDSAMSIKELKNFLVSNKLIAL